MGCEVAALMTLWWLKGAQAYMYSPFMCPLPFCFVCGALAALINQTLGQPTPMLT